MSDVRNRRRTGIPRARAAGEGPSSVVIVVDHAYINGGQAKVALESAIGLAARGVDVTVFAAVGPEAPALARAGVRVVLTGRPEFVDEPNKAAGALRGLWDRAAEAELAALLARQPEGRTLVHVHGFAKALSAAIARAINRSGHPALFSLHDYFLACPNGGFYNYRHHHACDLKPMSAACFASHCDTRHFVFKLWRVARFALGRHVFDLPAIARDVACFHAFQRAIIAPHLPAESRLHMLPNPVDTENLGEKPDPTAGDIVFVGRLSLEKGCHLYAEAMARAGLRARFVGDGPLMADLKARFPDAVFDGWQDAAGVRRALRAARAMVFPSLLFEGQPLTVLESLSLGTPVITGDGTAGRESVIDGETGLWFRQADAGALSEAIGQMKDDALIARLSKAAHARYWADPLTMDRHLDRLQGIYASLMNRAGEEGETLGAALAPSAA